MNQIRNLHEKWYRGNTLSLLTSRKTEIAKYAREPRLQGFLPGTALEKQYLEQKTLVTCTRFSHSMDTIIPESNENFSRDGNEFTKVSRAVGKAESHLY